MPVASPGDEATAELAVGQRTIDDYAALTGDDNPLHLDREYAADGFFGERIAHGMLGAGVVSAALARLPGDVVYLSQDLSFEAPVTVGDTVVATASVTEVVGGDRVRVATEATVDGDVVMAGEAVVLSLEHGG